MNSKAKQTKKTKKLSLQRLLFCKEYIIDFNGTQAAIRAKYSKKTARSQAQRLLTNDDIQKEIQRLIKKRSKKLDITAERVLQEHAILGLQNICDYYNDDGSIKPLSELTHQQKSAILKIKTKIVKVKNDDGEEEDQRQVVDYYFRDKDKSLEALSKHTGIYEKDNEQKGNADLKTKQEFMEALMQSISKSDRGLPIKP